MMNDRAPKVSKDRGSGSATRYDQDVLNGLFSSSF